MPEPAREPLQADLPETGGGRAQGRPWAPAGHFYSPLVDPNDEYVGRALDLEARPPEIGAALGLDEAEILRWLSIMAESYDPLPFRGSPERNSLYHYRNAAFPLADALALLAVMKEKRPRRYIEAGCGFSSCAAIEINERFLGGGAEMTFLDPHPETLLELLPADSPHRRCVRRMKLQEAPIGMFAGLRAGDILFIDSSHVAKTGSDVLDYLFRVFPALEPGVAIHVHDVFFPFEYPAAWVRDENRSWNEAYFLRAFLHDNPRYRVFFFSDWVYKRRRKILEERMPLWIEGRGGCRRVRPRFRLDPAARIGHPGNRQGQREKAPIAQQRPP